MFGLTGLIRNSTILKKHCVQHVLNTAYPQLGEKFVVNMDGSENGACDVLSLWKDGIEKTITYFSKTFSKAEWKYYVTCKKLLAIKQMPVHFLKYLYGQEFMVISFLSLYFTMDVPRKVSKQEYNFSGRKRNTGKEEFILMQIIYQGAPWKQLQTLPEN